MSGVEAGHRVAVLCGGGLGDALAIRPLLQQLSAVLREPPFYCSARFARSGITAEMGVRALEVPLAMQPLAAIRALRALGAFDLVYLGPHPTWGTRALAATMKARRVWHEPAAQPNQFLPDAVCEDIRRLGLVAPGAELRPYGALPLFAGSGGAIPIAPAQLIVHLTARRNWQAKQWPIPSWVELIERLAQSRERVVCVGSAAEAGAIDDALRGLSESARSLVRVETGLTLAGLERLIAASRGVVCHNSGVMHIAAALQKPTVVLNGASPRCWWPSMPWVRNLSFTATPLSVEQVLAAVHEHIAGGDQPRDSETASRL